MEPNIVIVWDPLVVSPEDYASLVVALGDIIRASGGVGITRLAPGRVVVKEKEAGNGSS